MKKILLLITMVFALFVCVAITPVSATGSTWYEQAASEVNNPVLLENEEYYQGVSVNSNLISDLTFLQIPFEKYLSNKEKQIQVITITEALYKNNDEIESEIVLYLYSPYFKALSLNTQIVLYEKTILQNDEMLDVTPKQLSYNYDWSPVSNYENIYNCSRNRSNDYRSNLN